MTTFDECLKTGICVKLESLFIWLCYETDFWAKLYYVHRAFHLF